MASRVKSILTSIVIVTAALAGITWLANQGSRALAQPAARITAQAKAAPALEAEARAREAKAKGQEAAAAEAKARAVAVQAAAAQAAELKKAAAAAVGGAKPVPLDMSKTLNMKAEIFEKVKRYPWPAVPRGSQTFAGVPVEIQGATMTFGQRNADNGLKYPEAITGIPCGQKFETLYIVHGAFYEAASGEPAFDVVLNYAGDEKQTDTILCGEDTRDWYIKEGEEALGPSAKRSTLAWKGTGKSGMRDQDIRFCITAIDNKYPDRVVETIDLVSPKKQTAGCILAITVGKRGLLKPEQPADKPADSSPPKVSTPKVTPPKVRLPASP
jgi:hypothetical protein